jgi:hypothetical protein
MSTVADANGHVIDSASRVVILAAGNEPGDIGPVVAPTKFRSGERNFVGSPTTQPTENDLDVSALDTIEQRLKDPDFPNPGKTAIRSALRHLAAETVNWERVTRAKAILDNPELSVAERIARVNYVFADGPTLPECPAWCDDCSPSSDREIIIHSGWVGTVVDRATWDENEITERGKFGVAYVALRGNAAVPSLNPDALDELIDTLAEAKTLVEQDRTATHGSAVAA